MTTGATQTKFIDGGRDRPQLRERKNVSYLLK
jgi:hypothetical protein